MKKVLLIANYFHFKKEKESNRFRILADMLSVQDGIELEVITSSFYQRTKTFRNKEELAASVNYKVKFIDEPGYDKNISFRRLRTSKAFAKNTLKYLKSQPLPDLIYQAVPTLDVAAAITEFANKNDIPVVIDIQDLWPEAFKMAFKVPVISDILFYPLKRKANGIYKRADAICAVSETYVKRALAVNKKCKEGHAVYIGINLSAFDGYANRKPHDGERVKLVYCGSMEKSYDITTVIDALSLMDNPPQFIVIGDGSLKEHFREYAEEKNVDAVFTGYLSYDKMCEKLCECDITVNPIIGESVASIINKHGDYAASGLPVVNTQNSAEYRSLIDEYRMGFNCKSGDAEDMAEKLKLLTENKELREELGRNARRAAEEKFDREQTYNELVSVIKGLL